MFVSLIDSDQVTFKYANSFYRTKEDNRKTLDYLHFAANCTLYQFLDPHQSPCLVRRIECLPVTLDRRPHFYYVSLVWKWSENL